MSEQSPRPDESSGVLALVDELCDDFERSWKQASRDERPSIEDYLARLREAEGQDRLFRELLALEVELRQAHAESPRADDYSSRFPQFDEIVRAYFAAREAPRSWANQETAVLAEQGTNAEIDAGSGAAPAYIGRYKILQQLGRGGFGVVYKAHDPGSDRLVAIKLLRDEFCTSEPHCRAFEREANAAMALAHDHFVRVLALDRDEQGRLFIVQQLIDGGNLRDWMKATRRGVDEILGLMIPVADAVAYLHRSRLFHRDLKPNNILLDATGRPYIADFGLALHESELRSREGEVAGTFGYMAPEQIRGRIKRVDGRTDIWSLGVMLYELLSGRLPFGGVNLPTKRQEYFAHLQEAIEENDPEPLRTFVPELSRELEDICLRCLEKEKRHRFKTGDDLAEALRKHRDRRHRRRAGQARSPADRATIVTPKGLRSFDKHDRGFFLELLPGPRVQDNTPACVRFWSDRLGPGEPEQRLDVCVVYGPSGSGKSSLVKAGVLPTLSEGVVAVTIEATANDTEARLRTALRKLLPSELNPADLSLGDLFRQLQLQPAGRKVLVVVDQFEQWLNAHPQPADADLVKALECCNGVSLQGLLLVRDDFWMPLTRFMDELAIPLREGENCAAVDLFDRDHARKVLMLFGQAYHRLPATEAELTADQTAFLDRAIDQLAENEHVICVRLSLFADLMRGRPWTIAELNAVGGAQGVGVKFLEEKFGAHAPAVYRNQRAAAQRVLNALLPESGSEIRGQMCTVEQLRAAANQNAEMFQELLRILDGDLKLLTPVIPDRADEAPPDGSAAAPQTQYYQLTHDFLVPSLREWLTTETRRTPGGRALLRLRERSDDWNRHPEPRRLPTLSEWSAIKLRVSSKTWTLPQRRMMRAASRRILSTAAAVLSIVAVLSGIAWEINGRRRAQDLLTRLAGFDTSRLPDILAEAASYERWFRPLVESTHRAEFANTPAREANLSARELRHRMHLSLALSRWRPDALAYVVDHVSEVAPESMPAVVEVVRPRGDLVAAAAWPKLDAAAGAEPRTDHSHDLPVASLLAGVDSDNPRWSVAAPGIARQLIGARPGQFSGWLNCLSPVQDALSSELLDLWRSNPTEGQARTQLLEAIAQFASQSPHQLLAAVEEAEAAELAMLHGALVKLPSAKTTAATRFSELSAPDSPIGGPPASLASVTQLFERYHGFLDSAAGFVQEMPLDQFTSIATELAREKYRPESFRPYRHDNRLLVAAAWRRDGLAFLTKTNLTADELVQVDKEAVADGLAIHDFARNGDGRWAALWVEGKGEGTRFYVDTPYPEHAARFEAWAKAGLGIEREAIHAPETGPPLATAIWRPMNVKDEPDVAVRVRTARNYGDLKPGDAQMDLRVEHFDLRRRDRLANYVRFFDQFEKVAEQRNPEDKADPLLLAARYQVAMGDFEEALVTLSQADAVKPDTRTAAELRVLALALLNRMDEAREEFARFDELKPSTVRETVLAMPTSLFLRVVLACQERNHSAAIATLQELESQIKRRDLPFVELLVHARSMVAGLAASDERPSLSDEAKTSIDAAVASVGELLARTEMTLPEEFVNRVYLDGLRSDPAFTSLLRSEGLDRRLTAISQSRPDLETRQIWNVSLPSHAAESRKLRAEGYLPRAVSVSISPLDGGPAACSVWVRHIAPLTSTQTTSSRLANLAVSLATMGDMAPLEDLLADRHGVEARSFALERAAAVLPVASALQMIRQPSADGRLRNWLRLLGKYDPSTLSEVDYAWINSHTAALANEVSDPGVHSAAVWLRRQWKLPGDSASANSPSGAVSGKQRWYRNPQGHTMAVLDLHQPVLLGSPVHEKDRERAEMLHWIRIGRIASLSTTETTVKQFEEFLSDPKVKQFYLKKEFKASKEPFAPLPDCPQISIRWYDAARYCQWLSEQAGLPESEWCFPGIWECDDGELKLPDNILDRRGYRLPTQAEFEAACRCGWQTARPFGTSERLLPGYAWFAVNARRQTHEVASLMPNDFGFFDMLGNANEWCLDAYDAYRVPLAAMTIDRKVGVDTSADNMRVIRGGAFNDSAEQLRSASRERYAPNLNTISAGFRVARSEGD